MPDAYPNTHISKNTHLLQRLSPASWARIPGPGVLGAGRVLLFLIPPPAGLWHQGLGRPGLPPPSLGPFENFARLPHQNVNRQGGTPWTLPRLPSPVDWPSSAFCWVCRGLWLQVCWVLERVDGGFAMDPVRAAQLLAAQPPKPRLFTGAFLLTGVFAGSSVICPPPRQQSVSSCRWHRLGQNYFSEIFRNLWCFAGPDVQ